MSDTTSGASEARRLAEEAKELAHDYASAISAHGHAFVSGRTAEIQKAAGDEIVPKLQALHAAIDRLADLATPVGASETEGEQKERAVAARAYEVHIVGPDDLVRFDDELKALRHANDINKCYLADRLKHPDDDVMCIATVTELCDKCGGAVPQGCLCPRADPSASNRASQPPCAAPAPQVQSGQADAPLGALSASEVDDLINDWCDASDTAFDIRDGRTHRTVRLADLVQLVHAARAYAPEHDSPNQPKGDPS